MRRRPETVLALALTLASMVGCPSITVPVSPVPVSGYFTRCDPARLGWAADGSLFYVVQAEPLSPIRVGVVEAQVAA